MPARNEDLHGSVPDKAEVALLLIDVINDLEFEDGEKLLRFALPMAEKIAELKKRARKARAASSSEPRYVARQNSGGNSCVRPSRSVW